MLGRLVARDPVLMLELCKTVSSTAYARGETSNLMPPGQMITLLGVAAIGELLQSLSQRVFPEIPEVLECLEECRAKCLKVSQLARLIGAAVDPLLADQCEVLGLFARFGDVLACLYLGPAFTAALHEEPNRAKFTYRLAREHTLDIERAAVRYLNTHGLPEKVVACIDRDSQVSSPDLINRKLVVLSSVEILNAYEESKWDKYAPDRPLPARSYLRPLKFLGLGYERLYEDLSENLAEPLPVLTQLDGRTAVSDDVAVPESITVESTDTVAGADQRVPAIKINRSFLARPHPLVVASIRGIRNAENLFAGIKNAPMKDAMTRLVTPMLAQKPLIGDALHGAARAYHPLSLFQEEIEGISKIVEVMSSSEISAVIALAHLSLEFARECSPAEWSEILLEARRDIEIGRLLGSMYDVVGTGAGMLMAGVRRFGLGVFLYFDPAGYRQYKTQLEKSRKHFDLVFERTRWKKDHFSFCAPILQSLGFGSDLIRAVEGGEDPFSISDKRARYCAIVSKWVQIIRENGHAFGDTEFLRQLGAGKDEILMLDAEVKRLLKKESPTPWLIPGRKSSSHDREK